ncbi:ABC-2 transporter permease [Paenibacillus piri]|uniref:ABC-2 transporter permease n=1 Tax=Paenibacillus piri TaxID=2547395 RepID=UPI0014051205|nr:ABC-2 transporter permease [Paenibacillus piri]
MHPFKRLFMTDLRNRRNAIVVSMAAMLLVHTAIMILTDHTQELASLGFIMVINIVFFAIMLFIPFLHSFSAWREEWKQHSIYYLLSLPIPRTYLLLSKYLVILLEALLITVVMVAGLWIQLGLSNGMLFRVEPLLLWDAAKVLLLLKWLFAASGLIFLNFTSVFLGKWSGKLSLPVAFVSFVAGLFVWIVAFANFPSFITLASFTLLFFGASYYLLDKKAEVA